MRLTRVGNRVYPIILLRLTNTGTRLRNSTTIIVHVRRLAIHRTTRQLQIHRKTPTNNRHVLNKGLTNSRTANQRLNDHRMLSLNNDHNTTPVRDKEQHLANFTMGDRLQRTCVTITLARVGTSVLTVGALQ